MFDRFKKNGNNFVQNFIFQEYFVFDFGALFFNNRKT